MSDVTRILEAAQQGDPKAADQLLPLVYDELRRNYRAEYTNDLASGNWTIFTNNAPGNGYLLWVRNYGGANQSRRFYRSGNSLD